MFEEDSAPYPWVGWGVVHAHRLFKGGGFQNKQYMAVTKCTRHYCLPTYTWYVDDCDNKEFNKYGYTQY